MEQDRQTVSRKYRMTRFGPMRNMVVETVKCTTVQFTPSGL